MRCSLVLAQEVESPIPIGWAHPTTKKTVLQNFLQLPKTFASACK